MHEIKIDAEWDRNDVFKFLLKESRHRPIVPFLGAGISVATGFPAIKQINQYLAKVDFAILNGVFKHRYPGDDVHTRYREHPSRFLLDFGWPDIGQLDADLWQWLTEVDSKRVGGDLRKNLQAISDGLDNSGREFSRSHAELIQDDLAYDLVSVELKGRQKRVDLSLNQRDFFTAITQFHLRRDLERLESGADDAALRQWKRWKHWRKGMVATNKSDQSLPTAPELLYGNWESLLDHLCEGSFDLVDQLFTQLEIGRRPSLAHRYLTFLKQKLDIPVVLTTNFDRLLEQALRDEGVAFSAFDIHRDADLPDPYLVRRQFSVLKLHGSSYGLRLGERLRYPLDAIAQRQVLELLPKKALLVVVGFSGYERRMLQLLRAVAAQARESESPRIIWLTLSSLSGWPAQLVNEYPKLVKQVVIQDAGTFLQEFYFRLGNCYPAAQTPYPALIDGTVRRTSVPRPECTLLELTPSIKRKQRQLLAIRDELSQSTQDVYGEKLQTSLSELEKELKGERERLLVQVSNQKPVHLFIPNLLDGDQSVGTEWATVSAAAFAKDLGFEYRQIWISLEGHHTVAGVVSEFFSKVQQFNPNAPRAPLSLHAGELENLSLEKVVLRMLDVFQRGKYVLVLDLLECFGRPQTMHHGIPTYDVFSLDGSVEANFHKKNLESEFKKRVELLGKFLKVLIGGARTVTTSELCRYDVGFGESFLCITVGGPPAHRYKQAPIPMPSSETYSAIKSLLNCICEGLINEEFSSVIARHVQKTDGYATTTSPSITQSEEVQEAFNGLSNWRRGGSCLEDKSFPRLRSIDILIEFLNTTTTAPRKPCGDAQCAFLGFMSIFRRARPMPLLRSVTERWIAGIATYRPPVLANVKVDPQMQNTASSLGLRLQELLDELSSPRCVFNPRTAELHEGGALWLYREVRDEVYEALTEKLSISQWVGAWKQTIGKPTYNCATAICDGLTVITWHWAAARSYYADMFRPTQDVAAFYEYVYHRTSALKVMTLMIEICIRHEFGDPELKEISDSLRDQGFRLEKGDENILTDRLGVFSPLGRSKQNGHEPSNKVDLVERLMQLREEGLTTLYRALHRNRDYLRRNATPSTLRGWAIQFLEREVHDLSGSVYAFDDKSFFQRIGFQTSDQLHQLVSPSTHKSKKAKYLANSSNRALAKLIELFDRVKCDAETADLSFTSGQVNAEKRQTRLSQIPKKLRDAELNSLRYAAIHDEMACQIEVVRVAPQSSQSKLLIETGGRIRDVVKELSNSKDMLDHLRRFRELLAKLEMSRFPIWEYYDSVRRARFVNPSHVPSDAANCFRESENEAIEYEKVLRATATASDDDRRHRTSALTLRARSLYLRGHFREAHRWLDLAAAGLASSTPEQQISLASVHICRAEQLVHSAFWHRFVRERSSPLIPNSAEVSVDGHLQKIKRAESELESSQELLKTSLQLPMWQINVEIGLAICISESLLYGLDAPRSQSLDRVGFARESGQLEQRVLKAMRHVRNALDTIPILGETTENALCVSLEKFAHVTLQQLFVVFLTCSMRLRVHCDGFSDASAVNTFLSDAKTVLAQASTYSLPDVARWKNWARSMRFTRIAEIASPINLARHIETDSRLQSCTSLTEATVSVLLHESCEEYSQKAFKTRRHECSS